MSGDAWKEGGIDATGKRYRLVFKSLVFHLLFGARVIYVPFGCNKMTLLKMNFEFCNALKLRYMRK